MKTQVNICSSFYANRRPRYNFISPKFNGQPSDSGGVCIGRSSVFQFIHFVVLFMFFRIYFSFRFVIPVQLFLLVIDVLRRIVASAYRTYISIVVAAVVVDRYFIVCIADSVCLAFRSLAPSSNVRARVYILLLFIHVINLYLYQYYKSIHLYQLQTRFIKFHQTLNIK